MDWMELEKIKKEFYLIGHPITLNLQVLGANRTSPTMLDRVPSYVKEGHNQRLLWAPGQNTSKLSRLDKGISN
jgi:hypothetical protein